MEAITTALYNLGGSIEDIEKIIALEGIFSEIKNGNSRRN